MKKVFAALIAIGFVFNSFAFALDAKKASFVGGTEKDTYFAGAKKNVEGTLNTSDEKQLSFNYVLNKKDAKTFTIPYDKFIDIEYGQKAGRRVGAAIATAILLSPLGLFLLFSKKRKHYVTIGYYDDAGKEQVAVFELGKDIVRTTLPILEARSGKKITYQDEDAKKSSKGN